MSINKNKSEFTRPELSVEELSMALYKANQQLTETNTQLKESERLRIELFSNLSHDIRSPLATLRSYVEYLLTFDSLDKDELILTLNQMHSKIMSIDSFINELLVVTSLDSQSNKLFSFEPVYIIEFLDDFYNLTRNDIKYKDRILISNLPSDFNFYTLIDIKMFHRVLDNLFTNALKYSNHGDTISISARNVEKEIIITVSDTGIGIQEHNLDKIFQRTFMVSEARTPSKMGGYGLGLSIASTIISKHNGKIWCESVNGEGSTFFISIPILPAFNRDLK